MDIIQIIKMNGCLPVVSMDDEENAASVADAVRQGGIHVIEIALRTKEAIPSILKISSQCADMVVGAGTVITVDDAKRSIEAGARFIVSPGLNPEVAQWCLLHSIPVIPGCVTPTEIMRAKSLGLKVIKFFPANVYGGINGIKALSGPFPDILWIPTGGVNQLNLNSYLTLNNILAVGGSWMCTQQDIRYKNYEAIQQTCLESKKSMLGLSIEDLSVYSALPEDIQSLLTGKKDEEKNLHIGETNHRNRVILKTNHLERGIYALSQKGFKVDKEEFLGDFAGLNGVTLKRNQFSIYLEEKGEGQI